MAPQEILTAKKRGDLPRSIPAGVPENVKFEDLKPAQQMIILNAAKLDLSEAKKKGLLPKEVVKQIELALSELGPEAFKKAGEGDMINDPSLKDKENPYGKIRKMTPKEIAEKNAAINRMGEVLSGTLPVTSDKKGKEGAEAVTGALAAAEKQTEGKKTGAAGYTAGDYAFWGSVSTGTLVALYVGHKAMQRHGMYSTAWKKLSPSLGKFARASGLDNLYNRPGRMAIMEARLDTVKNLDVALKAYDTLFREYQTGLRNMGLDEDGKIKWKQIGKAHPGVTRAMYEEAIPFERLTGMDRTTGKRVAGWSNVTDISIDPKEVSTKRGVGGVQQKKMASQRLGLIDLSLEKVRHRFRQAVRLFGGDPGAGGPPSQDPTRPTERSKRTKAVPEGSKEGVRSKAHRSKVGYPKGRDPIRFGGNVITPPAEGQTLSLSKRAEATIRSRAGFPKISIEDIFSEKQWWHKPGHPHQVTKIETEAELGKRRIEEYGKGPFSPEAEAAQKERVERIGKFISGMARGIEKRKARLAKMILEAKAYESQALAQDLMEMDAEIKSGKFYSEQQANEFESRLQEARKNYKPDKLTGIRRGSVDPHRGKPETGTAGERIEQKREGAGLRKSAGTKTYPRTAPAAPAAPAAPVAPVEPAAATATLGSHIPEGMQENAEGKLLNPKNDNKPYGDRSEAQKAHQARREAHGLKRPGELDLGGIRGKPGQGAPLLHPDPEGRIGSGYGELPFEHRKGNALVAARNLREELAKKKAGEPYDQAKIEKFQGEIKEFNEYKARLPIEGYGQSGPTTAVNDRLTDYGQAMKENGWDAKKVNTSDFNTDGSAKTEVGRRKTGGAPGSTAEVPIYREDVAVNRKNALEATLEELQEKERLATNPEDKANAKKGIAEVEKKITEVNKESLRARRSPPGTKLYSGLPFDELPGFDDLKQLSRRLSSILVEYPKLAAAKVGVNGESLREISDLTLKVLEQPEGGGAAARAAKTGRGIVTKPLKVGMRALFGDYNLKLAKALGTPFTPGTGAKGIEIFGHNIFKIKPSAGYLGIVDKAGRGIGAAEGLTARGAAGAASKIAGLGLRGAGWLGLAWGLYKVVEGTTQKLRGKDESFIMGEKFRTPFGLDIPKFKSGWKTESPAKRYAESGKPYAGVVGGIITGLDVATAAGMSLVEEIGHIAEGLKSIVVDVPPQAWNWVKGDGFEKTDVRIAREEQELGVKKFREAIQEMDIAQSDREATLGPLVEEIKVSPTTEVGNTGRNREEALAEYLRNNKMPINDETGELMAPDDMAYSLARRDHQNQMAQAEQEGRPFPPDFESYLRGRGWNKFRQNQVQPAIEKIKQFGQGAVDTSIKQLSDFKSETGMFDPQTMRYSDQLRADNVGTRALPGAPAPFGQQRVGTPGGEIYQPGLGSGYIPDDRGGDPLGMEGMVRGPGEVDQAIREANALRANALNRERTLGQPTPPAMPPKFPATPVPQRPPVQTPSMQPPAPPPLQDPSAFQPPEQWQPPQPTPPIPRPANPMGPQIEEEDFLLPGMRPVGVR